MIACHRTINTPDSLKVAAQLRSDVTRLSEGIASSIPFLLVSDLQSFLEDAEAGSPPIPGRPVGGLLSMNTLYVLSTLSVADPKLKAYARGCLAWIGDRMGIGQATTFSKVKP